MIPKFRAWHKKEKKMYDVGALMFTTEIISIDCGENENNLYLDFNDAIIMQSTGLKDKNGKEIFEGDIIKTIKIDYAPNGERHYEEIQIVEEIINPKNVIHDNYVFSREVIGNVHENKELLK